MITRKEAKDWITKELGGIHKVDHSESVAELMEALARQFDEDEDVWYLTGLLHDIDLPETYDDLKMHGILAREKLRGIVSQEVIEAIMSHEHGNGVMPKGRMAEALIFADLVNNIDSESRFEALTITSDVEWENLIRRLPNKEYHLKTIREFRRKWPDIRID